MPEEIARAVDVLRNGGLVAFPTETVYGLGADASSVSALRQLYAVKGRPVDHPVIVHVADADAIDDWAINVPDAARALASECWPGPLTMVFRRAPGVLEAVTGGQETVAVRVPDQPVALELLRAFDGGIAAPSANRFGRVSPTTADDVRADLGDDVAVVLDGGPCRVGVESTIVDCTSDPFSILRLGCIGRGALETAAGVHVAGATGHRLVRVPGALASHYAPSAQVRAVAAPEACAVVEDEIRAGARVGVVTSGDVDAGALPANAALLGAPATVEEYAHGLYHWLHAADAQRLDVVVAVLPTDVDDALGGAIADRLRRAAASRDTT
jgi:L-threonylcarbamoyladenylate synthase